MVAAGTGAILWLQTFKIPDECFSGLDVGERCLPYQATMFATARR